VSGHFRFQVVSSRVSGHFEFQVVLGRIGSDIGSSSVGSFRVSDSIRSDRVRYQIVQYRIISDYESYRIRRVSQVGSSFATSTYDQDSGKVILYMRPRTFSPSQTGN
jgi:hypothetical protein